MMSPRIVRVASWIYARLLHAYPRKLHTRFGDQMLADFQAQCADVLAERSAALAMSTWLLHALADLGWNASLARIHDAVPAARRTVRALRPYPGLAAFGVIVVVAPIVLLGKAFANRQPVLAGDALIYAAMMTLAVSSGLVVRDRERGSGRAILGVTRFACAFTTAGVIACGMFAPTSLSRVLAPDLGPLLLAIVTMTLATVFTGVSRLLRLR